MQMTDKAIIKRLFYQHYGEMTRLARMLLYSDDEAEDVVQDIFLRLMEAGTLPDKGKARATCYRPCAMAASTTSGGRVSPSG